MAKRPLRAWMRDKLINYAKEVVQPAAEKRAMDAAYKRAAPMVTAIVEKKYPAKDMKLLEKYGVAARHSQIKVQASSGQVVQMEFRSGDGVQVPSKCSYSQIFLGDDRAVAAIEAYNTAEAAYRTEWEKRVSAFRILLMSSAHVEDVFDVWPEAAKVVPSTEVTATLAPEQIAIIKADLRERKAA